MSKRKTKPKVTITEEPEVKIEATPKVEGDKIDIILATHNNLGLTIECVSALYSFTHMPFILHVIDDSDDLTPQYFEQLNRETGNVDYYRPSEKIEHGNQIINYGLERCSTDIVAYLGNSTIVEPEWLVAAHQIMKQEELVGLIGFKLLYQTGAIEHAGMWWTPEMPHHMNIGVGEAGHRHTFVREVELVGWALVLIKREAFPQPLDTVGYIGFRGYDDVDNCMELRRRTKKLKNGEEVNWKVIYCGLGAAYHKAGATRYRDDENYSLEHEYNRKSFLKKWGGTQQAIDSVVMSRVLH